MRTRETLFVEPERKAEAFLGHLVTHANVAAATQNPAFNALVFLYTHVLQRPLENVDAVRSRKTPRIPVVLSQDEVKQRLSLLEGVPALVVKLLYGGGLRITEAVRLRVQDIDFPYRQITIRDGKGRKDRVTPFATNRTGNQCRNQ